MKYDFLKLPFDKDVAEKLINGYCIIKYDTRYSKKLLFRIIELESYYYDSNKPNDDVNTFNRDCKAGEWFFHRYGVDISYDTVIENGELISFGGILIRSVEVYELQDEKWVISGTICGPILAMQEIFNHTNELPKLDHLPTEIMRCANIVTEKRIMGNTNETNSDSSSSKRAIAKDAIWDAKYRHIVEIKKGTSVKVVYKEMCKKYDYK